MRNQSQAQDREPRFTAMFDVTYAELLRFVQRRVHPDHAEDVVAECFLVAWRRFDDLPQGHGDTRAWLFGIARGLVLNAHPRNPRARATLERILATDPGPRPVKARPRHGTRLALAASGTAVTAAVAVVLVPSLTNGDRAFASWTAAPDGLSAQAAADAAADCRNAQVDGPGAEYGENLRRAAVAIAERRGEWTLVVLSGSDGFSAMCITDISTPLFRDWFGSVGMPANYTAPGPRDVVATDLGTGSASAGELSVAAGYVGSDVAGIAFQSVSHGDVVATVSAGRFALWLPGNELEDASRDGVELDVNYRDGSTGTVRIDLQ